jgi:hypothetical protein
VASPPPQQAITPQNDLRGCKTSPAAKFQTSVRQAARVCRHSLKREKRRDYVDCRSEARIGFVVSGGDATELLDPLEEVLDEMPPFVHLGVVWDWRFAVGLRRDDGNSAAFVERGAQGVVVERLVSDQGVEIDASDQWLDADAVVTLAWEQNEARQIAQRIDEGDDLGGQSAARPADGLILSPPFAPAPCR